MSKYIVRQVIVTAVSAECPQQAIRVVQGEDADYYEELENTVSAKLQVDPVDRVTAGMQQFLPLMQSLTNIINGNPDAESEPKTVRPPPPPEVPDLDRPQSVAGTINNLDTDIDDL